MFHILIYCMLYLQTILYYLEIMYTKDMIAQLFLTKNCMVNIFFNIIFGMILFIRQFLY